MASKRKTKKVDEVKKETVVADKVMAENVADTAMTNNVATGTDTTKTVAAVELNQNVAAVERYGTVISNRLNVRKGPSKTSEVIKIITKGDKVQIKNQVNDEWYEITGGFAMKAFIDG